MESKQLQNMFDASGNEIAYLKKLKNNLSKKKYDCLIMDVLSLYIFDKRVVKEVHELGTLSFEISIVMQMKDKVWFSNTIKFLIKQFRSLMLADQDKCISIIHECYPKIHESLACWHDAFFLQDHTSQTDPRLVSRACFKMLGDTIESVHASFVNFIYKISINNKSSPLFNRPENVSFGKAIDELINHKELAVIYKQNLYGVSFSQWRNIAQHSSYKYNRDKNKVVCSYGSNNKKSIEITIDELLELMGTLNILQALQKIALDFFLIEYREKIDLTSIGDLALSTETIISEMGLTLSLQGYNVISAQNILGNWLFKIEDSQGQGVSLFKLFIIGSTLSFLLTSLRKKGVEPIIELFDLNGVKLTECYLKSR
jgi:hypothetical protein